MSLPVEFLLGADAELQEIFHRFEDYREGFGVELLAVVEAYLTRLSVFPESAPIYVDTIRRQVLQRFPFGIFYEAHPTRILVTGILDLRQDEDQIRGRLRS
jgi:toxin ParE1/3/4